MSGTYKILVNCNERNKTFYHLLILLIFTHFTIGYAVHNLVTIILLLSCYSEIFWKKIAFKNCKNCVTFQEKPTHSSQIAVLLAHCVGFLLN